MRRALALLALAALCCGQDSAVLMGRVREGAELQNAGRFDEASRIYRDVLAIDPDQPDALHLLGLVAYSRDTDLKEASELVRRAVNLRPGDWSMLANFGELLRSAGDLEGALEALARAQALQPDSELVWRNSAAVGRQQEDWADVERCERQIMRCINIDPEEASDGDDWRPRLGLAEAVQNQGNDAFKYFELALKSAPREPRVLLTAGVAAQHDGRLEEAFQLYERASTVEESTEELKRQSEVNMAAVLHERGLMLEAIERYERVLKGQPEDTQALNNLGAALVTVGRHDEAVSVLERCLSVDSEQPQALTNLALHYANEGLLERSYALMQRASELLEGDKSKKNQRNGLFARGLTMMPPMVNSTFEMCRARVELAFKVRVALFALRESDALRMDRMIASPVTDVEQVHFYLPYAGLNDRFIQEAIVELYELLSPQLARQQELLSPQLLGNTVVTTRVGFVSKFFGEHEPHGLLLEGVVEHLPRRLFRVVVCPIASPGRPAASNLLQKAADELLPLSLNFNEARATLVKARLDILIFADMLSEPMTYFLGFSRFAAIQVAFWGNPVTSGRSSIDYFVSADRMEHPTRCSLADQDEPYTEQVVLLDGQGIWYRAPDDLVLGDKMALRRGIGHGLETVKTLILCAQSNFKLHPFFDDVIRRVLLASPDATVVLTEGRRPRWTQILKARIESVLDEDMKKRLLFVPRQAPGEPYMSLLACADVIMHPFPFDGSRTSADGIALGVPVVTRPTVHLRARMAASFYITMGMGTSAVVASSAEEYVSLVAHLANDAEHRSNVSMLIRERQHLIWEDRHVVYEWARFLSRVSNNGAVEPGEVGCDAECLTRGQRPWWREMSRESRGSFLELAKEARRVYDLGDLQTTIALLSEVCAACFESDDERCAGLAPESRVRSDLGAALQQAGQLEGAERQLRRSLELEPNNAVALNNLAVTLHESSPAEAAVLYERALLESRDPSERANALFNAANADRDAGDLVAATSRLRSGLGLAENGAEDDLALEALLEEADHHPTDARLKSLRDDFLIPTTSFAVMLSHQDPTVAARFSAIAAKLARREPWWLAPLDGHEAASSFEAAVEAPPTETTEAYPLGGGARKGLHLIAQPFRASSERTAELSFAFLMNLQCDAIEKVHLLAETPDDATFFAHLAKAAELDIQKLVVTVLNRRIRFSDALAYASDRLSGEVVALANADIFFDESLLRLGDMTTLSIDVLALSRWDWTCSGDVREAVKAPFDARCQRLEPRTDSQDSWIFRAPLNVTLPDSKLELGRPRCDNHFAALLFNAGHKLSSPSLAIRTNHVENLQAKTDVTQMKRTPLRAYPSDADEVKGASRYVPISDRWLF